MTILVSCNIIDTAERSSMMLLGTSLMYWKQCLSRMWSQWTPLSVGPLSIQPLFLLIHTVSWWRWEGGGVGWAWCLAEMAAERRGSHGSGVSERFGGAVTLSVVTCIQCMTGIQFIHSCEYYGTVLWLACGLLWHLCCFFKNQVNKLWSFSLPPCTPTIFLIQ